MPDTSVIEDEEFSAQLEALFVEAEEKIGSKIRRPADAGRTEGASVFSPKAQVAASEGAAGSEGQSLAETLRRVAEGLERLNAGQEEQAKFMEKVGQAMEQKNSLSRTMFDALYGELKGYKDSFLLESMLTPVIRDVISLYDGTCELGRQMGAAIEGGAEDVVRSDAQVVLQKAVETMSNNVEHHAHFVLEVLERLGVTLIPLRPGNLDKRTQRAVAVEAAETQEEDQDVVKVVKRGFVWRDRVIRPEEVIIKKWKEGYLIAIDESVPK